MAALFTVELVGIDGDLTERFRALDVAYVERVGERQATQEGAVER